MLIRTADQTGVKSLEAVLLMGDSPSPEKDVVFPILRQEPPPTSGNQP
jgi:hypothetical protein